jgi:lipopolysaccharide export system permease protein
MKRIYFYMFREVLTAFLFASVAVSFVVLFTQSFRLLSFVIDNAGTMFIFFQLMGLLVPTFLPLVVPLGLGISVLFVYHKLAVDSELVVMRAAGISQGRLALPGIVLAGFVLLFCYLLSVWITPAANRALVALQYRVRDNFSIYLVKPGAFNDMADGLTFYARARGKEGDLKDILVHDVRHPDVPVTIMAQRGRLAVVNNEPQVVIFKGKRQEFDRASGRLSQLDFDQYVLDLKLLRGKSTDRLPDPREQTMSELLNPPGDPALRRRPMGHIDAELHQRLASPLLALSFAMIGLTTVLAGQFNRRGMAKRILLAAVVIIALQASEMSVGSLISRHRAAIPLLYFIVLVPVPVCLALLKSWSLGFRFRRNDAKRLVAS